MTSLSGHEEKRKIRISLGERIFYIADDILMILLCVIILIPLTWVIFAITNLKDLGI